MRQFVIGLFLLASVSVYSQARRAESLIEKEKYKDAYVLLTKAVQKDSLAAAEKYVMAGLLFNEKFEQYDLDSAYWYILESIKSFELTEEKEQQKLIKDEFTTERFIQQKREIGEAGFTRAKKGNKEQDYITFLNDFSTSQLVDSAIWYRNKVAFELAERENVYQSYKQFFDKYPEAEQVKEARTRYEKLLFITKTTDGKLRSYQDFLKNYPETWHRDEAEHVIYNIITGAHTREAYQQFRDQYPDSKYARQSRLAYYSLSDNAAKEGLLKNKYLDKQDLDSIRLLEDLNSTLLIPSIDEERYIILDDHGEVVFNHLDAIADQSKCINENTRLLLIEGVEENILISMDSAILAKGKITSFKDRGDLIKIITDQDEFFIHANGKRTNPNSFNHAELCGPYIAIRENKKWGLETITGIRMFEPQFDSLVSQGDNVLVKKGKKWGITTTRDLVPLIDGEQVSLKFQLDEVEILENKFVYVQRGKKSALYNDGGEMVVPFADQLIELADGFIFIDREDSIKDTRYSSQWFKDIHVNNNWFIGKRKTGTDVYFNKSLLFNVSEAKVLGNTAVLVTDNDSTHCYFNDSTKLLIGKGEWISQINSIGEASVSRHYIHTLKNGKSQVYNYKGQLIKLADFKKLLDLGDQYMLWQNRKNFYLLDSTGQTVLKNIEAATCLDNGYISYMEDNKFGLFNLNDNTLIDPKYDKPLKSYSDSLFVFTLDDKYGIINRHDTILVPGSYEEINSLNDTLAFIKKDFRWSMWDLNNRQSILNGVSNYWKIKRGAQDYYKIFKGIGYGIWTPENGIILNSTFGEISIVSKGEKVVFIAEKWVEEADLVVMLYYNIKGELIRKAILSTAQYEELTCNN